MFTLENYIANQYLRALVLLLMVFIVLRISIFIIEKVFVRLTKKTKTDLDDKLIARISKPITFLILIIGLYIASLELSLVNSAAVIITKIFWSFVILNIAIITYAFVDVVLINALKKVARKTKSDLDDSLINLSHGVLKVSWVIFSLLYILGVWGVKVGPFLAGIGIGGVAIAFAMQESLSNIFGGISIILDKTVKVGDIIYFDVDTRGEIINIGLRSTKIKTYDNEVITIPNSLIANNKVQNIAQPEPKSRVVIPFSVAYGSSVEKVKKIVLKEIKKIKNFSETPEPVVRFLEMADSSLNFKAYFYVDSFEYRILAVDEANTRIYNALNKAKIEIPFPQIDIHLKRK